MPAVRHEGVSNQLLAEYRVTRRHYCTTHHGFHSDHRSSHHGLLWIRDPESMKSTEHAEHAEHAKHAEHAGGASASCEPPRPLSASIGAV
jgi:hypothetical protein